MSEAYHCTGCSALLPSPDAVCPSCDRELEAETKPQNTGVYRCPACACHFAKPEKFLPPVAWYKPQDFALRCPHCKTGLRDKSVRPQRIVLFSIYAFVLLKQIFMHNKTDVWIALGCYVLIALYLDIKASKSSNRYLISA